VHEDDILDWDSEPIHNSRPPLRWIANLFGEVGGWAIMRCSCAEEDGNKFKAKLYCKIFDAAYPFYQKYGTFYKIKWNNED
jgi:hypothetical protein